MRKKDALPLESNNPAQRIIKCFLLVPEKGGRGGHSIDGSIWKATAVFPDKIDLELAIEEKIKTQKTRECTYCGKSYSRCVISSLDPIVR